MGKTLLKSLVVGNNLEGFEKLLSQAEALRVQAGLSKVAFGLEPTGDYHKALGEHLIKCAKMVVLVSGVALRRNRELLDGRWDKHDVKDAANVADLMAQGKCMFYEYPDSNVRDLRVLLSLKMRLRKQEHGLRVRIRNHLVAQYFPELDRVWGQSDTVNLAIVRWCLDPSVVAGLELDEFVRRVCTRDRGVRQHARLKRIWNTAVDSIGCQVPEAVEVECKVMVESLRRLREDIKEVSEEIHRICLRFSEYPFLLSIPGFGPEVSAQGCGISYIYAWMPWFSVSFKLRGWRRKHLLAVCGQSRHLIRPTRSSRNSALRERACELRYRRIHLSIDTTAEAVYGNQQAAIRSGIGTPVRRTALRPTGFNGEVRAGARSQRLRRTRS